MDVTKELYRSLYNSIYGDRGGNLDSEELREETFTRDSCQLEVLM